MARPLQLIDGETGEHFSANPDRELLKLAESLIPRHQLAMYEAMKRDLFRRMDASHATRPRRNEWLGFDAYDKDDRGYTTACWIFRGKPAPNGYTRMKLPSRSTTAHRAYYEHYVGPIPEGLTIDHLCKVRNCVNPAHLEPVSRGENCLRGTGPSAINAQKTHCKHGHPFDTENTRYLADGSRDCITCRRARLREHRARKAA